MQWQDWALTAGSWLLNISLIASIKGKQKPALTTSLIYASILSVFVFTFLTLNLILTAATTAFGAIGWGILAVQRFRQSKK